MRKKAWKLRELNIRRSRDAMRKLSRNKKRKKSGHSLQKGNFNLALPKGNDTIPLHAPDDLNFSSGIAGTLSFFEHIKTTIQRCEKGKNIFFDLSKVTKASAAAIMYIIALIRNVRKAKEKNLSFSGNLPEDKSARLMFARTGFLRFVQTYRKTLSFRSAQNVQIMSGNNVDTESDIKICNFVQSACGTSMKSTKVLYRMIVELMTNTTQHAYNNDKGDMNAYWYLYAEDEGQAIKFVFLDTGEGIPATVKRTFPERVKQLITKNCDEELLESALNGAFRTSTGKSYRGRGLPDICRDIKTNPGAEMQLISGRGECSVSYNGNVVACGLNNNIGGTLFVWKYDKNELRRCNNDD